MKKILYDNLYLFSKKVLKKNGASSFVSETLSKGLCQASLRGVDSHGIKLLNHYIQQAKKNKKNFNPSFKSHKAFPSIELLDADRTFGITAGYKAVDIAIKNAKKFGMGMTVVKNSTHPGALASICLRAADKGYGILGFTNADALMLTHNGKVPLLGTNPICFCCPFEKNNPFCLDMATTTFTWNKLITYKNKKKLLPKMAAATKSGVSTINPEEAFSLLPIGGYKGFGLAIMVEILTAILANMPLDYEIPPMFSDTKKKRIISQLYLVFKINVGGSNNDFKKNLQKLANKIRKQKNNKTKAMMPNDKENKIKKIRKTKGIPLDKNVYLDLLNLSNKTGVKLKIEN